MSDWARMAFFMYGGEAQYNFSAAASSMQPATIGATPFASSKSSNTPQIFGAEGEQMRFRLARQ